MLPLFFKLQSSKVIKTISISFQWIIEEVQGAILKSVKDCKHLKLIKLSFDRISNQLALMK